MLSSHFILMVFISLGIFARFCYAEDIAEYEYDDDESLDEATDTDDEPIDRKSRFVGSFENQFVGTNLLGPKGLSRKCFTPEDEELLSARMAFEVIEI